MPRPYDKILSYIDDNTRILNKE
ncbi:uncharacterized protein G2W53_039230 [Senna tora]|uniref:Uncharacterized protein n=1 Tax=Senna tora TaxID=362788 RepID=A0A834SNA4_9FABA|nr:uncharacterized protein G2W53_039230 [Senna tora]